MSDLRKAAEMALERLKSHEYWMDEEAIKALRQALAQPEQKPVAIVNEGMGGIEWLDKPLPDDTPLYTAPPKREWVGLTDNEVEQIGEHYSQDRLVTIEEAIRHVESVLKEKNA